MSCLRPPGSHQEQVTHRTPYHDSLVRYALTCWLHASYIAAHLGKETLFQLATIYGIYSYGIMVNMMSLLLIMRIDILQCRF